MAQRIHVGVVRAVKAVQQTYHPDAIVLHLLDQFRLMVNLCIQIGVEQHVSSLKALSLKAYPQLSAFDVMSYYKLCAISASAGALRNYRKAKRKNPRSKEPYARKLHLTTCYGFKIRDGELLLPLRPREHLRTPLTKHVQETMKGCEVRSVTITQDKLTLAIAKDAEDVKVLGLIGVDRNLDNVTLACSDGSTGTNDLSEAGRVKATYRQVRSRFRRNDHRIRRRVAEKYGVKQREKVRQILYQASKAIIQQAKHEQFGIVMEKLTGIRKLYRKGNGQGHAYRARMNSWSYAELQRQIEYKARWEGLLVIYVNPAGTSRKCSICGSRMARIPEENRLLTCHSCWFTVDRDVNAARNILGRELRFGPIAHSREAMVAESERKTVIRKVDGWELTTPTRMSRHVNRT
jgi:putative transposase